MDNIEQISDEFLALSSLCHDFSRELETLDGKTLTEAELKRHFGITPGKLKQLVADGRVRPVRKGARVYYHADEVLREVAPQPATRLRRRRQKSSIKAA